MDTIVGGILALLELTAAAVQLVYDLIAYFIGLLIGAADTRKPSAQRRTGAVAALVILSIFVGGIVLLGGWWWYADHQQRVAEAERKKRAAQVEQARLDVDRWADQLDQRLDEKDRYIAPEPPLPVDSWGRSLAVAYGDEPWGESLTARSAGPDGQFDTEDDIVAWRKNVRTGDVGRAAANAVADKIQDRWRRWRRGDEEGQRTSDDVDEPAIVEVEVGQ